jgi:Trk K+ transport system NAD-binding subunit
VEDASPIKAMKIDAVRQEYEVTVLMHQKGNDVDWNPPPDTVLNPGDKVLIMADNKNIQTFIDCQRN